MGDSQYRDFESESNPQHGAGVKAELKSEVRERYEQVKDASKEALGESQSRIAEHVERLGRALKRGGRSLHDEQELSLGDYANRLGAGCDRFARYLRTSQPQAMVDDLSSGVRRHPEFVLGGLFLVGLGLARFLRASSSEPAVYERNPAAPKRRQGSGGDDDGERLAFAAEDEQAGNPDARPSPPLFDNHGQLIEGSRTEGGASPRASSL